MGRQHDVWDVHTNVGRWWIITNPTNYYSQQQFPSMDIAITFHIGLMARVFSQSEYAVPKEKFQRFANAWRCWQQAAERFEEADEAEEFQSVGKDCRQSLLAYVSEARSVVTLSEDANIPQEGNFLEWSDLIANVIAAGTSAERRRGHLKSVAKSTWQLANWLTHATKATRFDAEFTLDATEHVLSAFTMSILRFERGIPERCPQCQSYKLGLDYVRDDDGNKWKLTFCMVCDWKDGEIMLCGEESEDQEVESNTSQSEKGLGACVIVEIPLRGPKPPNPRNDGVV